MDPSLNNREYDSDFSGVKARARTSSGRRSRKSSTSSSLVRVLIEDKLDAERLAAELNRANELLRIESRRAHDAERVAREAQEFLKGVEHARIAAQQETARVKAELRLYKVQYENAQTQLMRANEMIREADAEREEALEAMAKMRKRMERYREAELERRAREEGRKEGRQEVLRERGVLREDEDEEDEQAQLDDGILQPTPIQASPRGPPPMPMSTPGPVSMPIESPPARSVPDHIIVRSPAALPIPPPDLDPASRFPPPERPPSRAATINYPPYPAMHSSHARNYSVPNGNAYGPPSTSSSDSLNNYGYGAPVRPLSRNVTEAIVTMGERDRELGNRTPGGLGLSGVPSVHTRTPGPYQSQTPGGRRMSLISEPEIIVPRPPSQPSTPSQPIALAPSFELYTRPDISSITPTNSTSSTDSTGSSTSSTETLTGQEPPVAQTPRIAALRRESSESAGSGRRYSSGSSVPGIIIEPPSRPESTGTVMTTATVPVFYENPRSPGPMSPGVMPSAFPPFDAQPIPSSNTPGPSARRASFAGSETIPDGFSRGAPSVHSASGEEPPPGFMGAASPVYDGGPRTPSLRHTHSRPQSRASMASTHRDRGRAPPPPTIPEEGFPPEGSAAEYFHQREPASGYFDAAAAGGRGSPSMSTISARRVPLPPGSSIGEESRPASRASRTYGHTPYRRPTSGLYD